MNTLPRVASPSHVAALPRLGALPGLAALARVATVAAALALFLDLGVRPAVDPIEARAAGPLPACRYDDILTTPRQYTDWSITLVDTILRVPRAYVPPDLVPVSQAGIAGKGQIRALVIDDLRAMSEAAAAANAGLAVVSAYRSYDTQKAVFDKWVGLYGRAGALKVSARPGHSEHQLGLALDFGSASGGSTLSGSWAATPAGKWMKAHSWAYGFVMSYPKGKTAVTCYSFEPWHFRYVGRELAGQVHASGLTLREFLWKNFTTTVVPPPTPRPAVTAKPSRTPSQPPAASPSAIPSASPTAPLPTASPSPIETPLPATAPPTPVASPAPIDPEPAAGIEPGIVAGAGLAIGTIVLGGAWLTLRRGRSGVGL